MADTFPAIAIKASPLDIEAFRQEISVKYPTFTPPLPPAEVAAITPTPAQTVKLAQAYSPIPVRHHYDRDDTDSQHQGIPSNSQQSQYGQQSGSSFRGMPQPATPAPTPPPSPKPKKQQFQTDQTRPFLFPFSRSRLGQRDARLVPFAIDEADKLYNKHMYVSVSLWQMWRTREECMTTESGLAFMPGSERVEEPKIAPSVSALRRNSTHSRYEYPLCVFQDGDTSETLPDVALLDAKIAEAESAMAHSELNSDKRKARERREDLMRLKRVEQIYVRQYLLSTLQVSEHSLRALSYPFSRDGSWFSLNCFWRP